MSDQLRSVCIEVIKGFVTNPDEMKKIESNESILASSSFDSLSIVNLVVKLENEFKINVDTDNFDTIFMSLESLTAYITETLSTKNQ